MVSTDAIARTLQALANRTATARPPYAGIVDEADGALDDLERAAGFVDADGLARLSDAVDAARRSGRDDLAKRGKEALDAYRRLQAATAPSRNPYTTEGATSDE